MKVFFLSIFAGMMPFISPIMAKEVLAVCTFDKICASVSESECQSLEEPVIYKLCVMIDDQGNLSEQGITIWAGGKGPTTGGAEENYSDYSGTIFDNTNPNEVTVIAWKNPDDPKKLENKYTLIGEALMGSSIFYIGDPKADSSLPFYTGFCRPIYERTCEGIE